MIFNEIADIPKCPIGAGPHGVYPTTRRPSDAAKTWGDVGVNAVGNLAAWVAALPPVPIEGLKPKSMAVPPAPLTSPLPYEPCM